jgi:hypothetical protein
MLRLLEKRTDVSSEHMCNKRQPLGRIRTRALSAR